MSVNAKNTFMAQCYTATRKLYTVPYICRETNVKYIVQKLFSNSKEPFWLRQTEKSVKKMIIL